MKKNNIFYLKDRRKNKRTALDSFREPFLLRQWVLPLISLAFLLVLVILTFGSLK